MKNETSKFLCPAGGRSPAQRAKGRQKRTATRISEREERGNFTRPKQIGTYSGVADAHCESAQLSGQRTAVDSVTPLRQLEILITPMTGATR